MQPVTRYVTVDGSRIAYQEFGAGPVTIVVSAGSFSHTDVIWEDPAAALFYTRLATFARVVRYDRLGTSNSDPLPPGWEPTLAGFGQELEAVLDAVGADEVVLMAMLDAGPYTIAYAAAVPDRVRGLILYNTSARFIADDAYPIGFPPDAFEEFVAGLEAQWGTDAQVVLNVPSRVGDTRFALWYSKFVRSLGTPTTHARIMRSLLDVDARPALAGLAVPTLVMHRAGYAVVDLAHGRYLADHIAGARFVEIPGVDGPVFWETPDVILEEIRAFVAPDAPRATVGRISTVLFTDIVRSTEMAESMGDEEWGAVVAVHRTIADAVVDGAGGHLVKWTGDGILAVFPDPEPALAAADRLRGQAGSLGLAVRIGLHTGRVEEVDDDVRGLAVHIAARVMAAAPDDEVVVSRTVRDLMLGSGHRFRDLGPHHLKGVDGEWELYALVT